MIANIPSITSGECLTASDKSALEQTIRQVFPRYLDYPISSALSNCWDLLQIEEMGRILIISRDGGDSSISAMSRTGPISIFNHRVWYHPVYEIKDYIVDLFHDPVICSTDDYKKSLEKLNPGVQLQYAIEAECRSDDCETEESEDYESKDVG